MKFYILILALTTLLLSASECGNKNTSAVYRGRLEIKGICSNYTISLLDDVDSLDISKNWTNEVTGKSYTNVFSLGNPCAFPSTIKEGEEFSFIIDTVVQKDCVVCMAYYPKPSKSLVIKVIPK